MSQTFTDDCYASTHQAASDLQAFEDNFAALKSAFSGASAPSNPVAGMWWHDTTAHILKHRNEANDAWLSVWDLANNKPIIANLVSADFAAAMKDAAIGTASLRTLGTGALQAMAGNTLITNHFNAQVFTSSGTWTRPTGVTSALILAKGAGGGGGGNHGEWPGGIGGSGGTILGLASSLTGDVTVTINAGGTGGVGQYNGGATGGTASFGSMVVAGGGSGGAGASYANGADGGVGAGSVGTNGTNLLFFSCLTSAYVSNKGVGGAAESAGTAGCVVVIWVENV
jgi:hypothetical protein